MGYTRTEAFKVDWPAATFDVDWNSDLEKYEISGSKSGYVYGRFPDSSDANAYAESMKQRAEVLRGERREGMR